MEYPLISCICPTRNRPAFLAQAIRLFQAQDYLNKELIIIDEHQGYGDMVAFPQTVAPDIHIVLLAGDIAKLTIGVKRNMACSFAHGEIICHWDDDDYFGPYRLSQQATPLLWDKADVSAMRMELLLHVPTMALWRMSKDEHAKLFAHDVRSGTLMYWRHCWEEGLRYSNSNRGEDVAYLNGLVERGARLAQVTSDTSYICVRHGGNVSDEMEYQDNPHFRREAIEDYVKHEDVAFYESMREKVAA